MDIQQVVSAIVATYPSRQPLMIWGAPGLGKSSAVKEAAQILNEQFYPAKEVKRAKLDPKKARFGCIDLRLPLLEPIDLRGLPHVQGDVAAWSRPSFLPTEGRGILFLDELVQAVPSMQAAASQLVLDRRIGEYVLPEGWHVVAAGNRLSDRAAVNAMPTHIANRFVHLYPEVDVDAWVRWALAHDVDIRVVAFIKFRPKLLHAFNPQERAQSFPSPRSWEFVSKMLATYQGDAGLLPHLIRGAIGDGPSAEFVGFLKVADKRQDPDAILLDPNRAAIPDDLATLYATVTALAYKASKDNIGSVIKYFDRITDQGRPEFAIAAMREIQAREPAVQNTRPFIEWASKHNHLLV